MKLKKKIRLTHVNSLTLQPQAHDQDNPIEKKVKKKKHKYQFLKKYTLNYEIKKETPKKNIKVKMC